MRVFWDTIRQIIRYRSAVFGMAIIGALVVMAIYAVITIPYSEAIRLWRGAGGIWDKTPRNAWPRWVNLFPGVNLPETLILSSKEEGSKSVQPLDGGVSKVEILFEFDYGYDDFPKEISFFFEPKYDKRPPHASFVWLTPDGRKIDLGHREAVSPYRLSLEKKLASRLGGAPEEVLFADPSSEESSPLKGKYGLEVEAWLFEEGSDLDVSLVVYGQVHGLAGTDHRRRDITVALLWGAPIALSFGVLAAVCATISTFIIAAIGVWYGKLTDATICWLTQVNTILPALPILIMVGVLYSRSIWAMLGMVIAISIFSRSLFVYRAMFLQVKESPYIEAAMAYGARSFRIIFRYMIPKVIPVLIPSFVILIPSYVFLEATLAILGLGDPLLPTWGKVMRDAHYNGALYKGDYYWMLLPAAMLMITGLGFSTLGYTLDRIFNPRLREL
jgi:peptide/nickel transport system permease protein